MKLVMVTHGETLPIKYESKEACIKDFMKLAIAYYKKLEYNYGRGSCFNFLGHRFDAGNFYFIFSDKTTQESPPIVLTLEEWFDKYIRKEDDLK